jgi:hypothetical protein
MERTRVGDAAAVLHPRELERVVVGQAASDGAGVRLTRVLTQDLQRRLDPFLMLDAFATENPEDYIAGFPDHPHRGFETVTYMLAGRMRHRDNAGHEGLLEPGGVQWMTAGRGIVHSEMPEQQDGRMEGFQLWLNLPAREKMRPPGYRDIAPEAIPSFETPAGVRVRVIAGRVHGVDGAVQRPDTEPLFLDLELPAGARFGQALPASHNAFVYVYRGALAVGAAGRPLSAGRMGILETREGADGLVVEVAQAGPGAQAARAIVVAGRPLREPIAQFGPFVMNTREEIVQAIRDFEAGRFG